MSNQTLKNKRLAERDRDALMAFAKKQIAATEDRAALDAAYERAADAIAALVCKENPPGDMKVLAKYNLAGIDSCVAISSGGGDVQQFDFNEDDARIPMRPYSKRGCRYGQRAPILMDDATHEIHKVYAAELKASIEQAQKRYNDFKALIWGTTSFNALAEVWPAVEAMREKIVGASTALSLLSDEVIDRLKADPALAIAA